MTEQQKKRSRRNATKLIGAAAGVSVLARLPLKWTKPEVAVAVLPAHAQTSASPSAKTPHLPVVTTDAITDEDSVTNLMDFSGTVVSAGGPPVTARGFVWSTTPGPTLPTNDVPSGSGTGPFSNIGVATTGGVTIYLRAYATNSVGTAYGGELSTFNTICLAEGTLITLADGRTRKIEEIVYSDWLSVWDFDEGRFGAAQPLWIKKTETANRYNLLEFSDGSRLKTISQHRIFNKEMGSFTYPMTNATPLGTTTFNINGTEVRLVSKRVVNETVNYYNVITIRHMNAFADGILTSCRYNNIYPIVDMKFVKDKRVLVPQEQYGLEDRYYEGMRLAEQSIPVADTVAYVNRLKAYEVKRQDMQPVKNPLGEHLFPGRTSTMLEENTL